MTTTPETVGPAGGADSRGAESPADDPRAADSAAGSRADDSAERVWNNLRTVVLGRHERRKEVSEALGMSFFRIKVLRRVAAAPARLSEIAAELSSDRPYTTLIVEDLAKRGLVERHQHPADRRSKIVSATPAGHAAADRANAILSTPPESLRALPAADLADLDRIVAALAAGE